MSAAAAGAAAAVAGALTCRAARAALRSRTPGGAGRWTRTNHRGEPVSLLAGPAVAAATAVGGAAGALLGGRSGTGRGAPGPLALALTTATVTAGALGVVDDLSEDPATRTKGLRGHLGALARGRLTTGGAKVLGIGAGGLAAAALVVLPSVPAYRRGRPGTLADVLVSGALVAAAANLVNLLDLRPGRALKASAVAATSLLGSGSGAGAVRPAAVGLLGVVVAALPADLDERDMLGDGGANALGAALGTLVVAGTGPRTRVAVLGALVALTLASERVSFTRVIEATPVLRELDAWGRRPPAPSGR
ncbi:hypothetical protein [Cellulomonas marina]|uniref:Glycosyl transferase family 4 n=1 Tax=Cellulomonas marina TaxID=988821 RepID=A0A1I0ZTQ5_9CELL|nr:hypothetical protein [Cellulomonas marina]GIG28780.1 hypothetical protein Cma02nite_13800 [Cellulomonas marina]SFB28742.1 Glycosyl transferase family 4 [Cellulomonas marina]